MLVIVAGFAGNNDQHVNGFKAAALNVMRKGCRPRNSRLRDGVYVLGWRPGGSQIVLERSIIGKRIYQCMPGPRSQSATC